MPKFPIPAGVAESAYCLQKSPPETNPGAFSIKFFKGSFQYTGSENANQGQSPICIPSIEALLNRDSPRFALVEVPK